MQDFVKKNFTSVITAKAVLCGKIEFFPQIFKIKKSSIYAINCDFLNEVSRGEN